ncbi:MAG: hypothetical protein ACRCWY_05780, partial [Cellulosilyticaceae bacterium]
MKPWFNNENKENKSKAKPKKGMLGDELSKAEKLGKQLRYREEDFAEEKEAEAWIEETKKEAQPKAKEVLKSSPFPAKRQSLKDKLRPDTEVDEQPTGGSAPEAGNKKAGIQFSSPFPPRKSVKTEEGLPAREEPKKPQVQMASPFPPRKNIGVPEAKPEVVASTPTPPSKPQVQMTSPFPPRRNTGVEEVSRVEEKVSASPEAKEVVTPVQEVKVEPKKQEPMAWEPVAPWMQSVSTRPEAIDRSEIHIEPSKKSLRTLAK